MAKLAVSPKRRGGLTIKLTSTLSELVGAKYVDDTAEALSGYSKDHGLFSAKGRADVIVSPGNAEEVHRVVQFANQAKIPVIPVSSSEHFHGCTIPKMGGIILDMRRMNRILDIDLKNRLARIEPGVTWGQIQGELEKINHRMIMPLFPLTTSSVVTSLLEREVPTNPRYEYSEPMTSVEVIWGNGMRFRTGSASTPGFPDKSVVKGGNPQGPGIDWYRFLQGAQGTMGVVTWAIVKFEFLPVVDKTYFIGFNQLADAIEPLYQIQRRMIGHEFFLVNNQVGALIFSEARPDDYEIMKRELPPWFMVLVLSGAPRFPEEKLAYEKEAIDEIAAQASAIKEIMTSLPGAAPGLEKRLPGMLRSPWPEDRVYWKHQLKEGCEEIILIATIEKVPQFTETVKKVAGAHGYDVGDLGVYVQPIEQGRACHIEYQFYYDPKKEDSIEKVRSIHRKASKILFQEGALFSRPYGGLSRMVYEKARGYANTLTKVKGVLDPNHIMCPGNICF